MSEIISDNGKKKVNALGGQVRFEQGNNRILVSKNLIDRLLLGQEDDGDIVVKLSQEGIDVKDASDSQLILNSANNLFKIVVADNTAITVPVGYTAGDQLEFIIPHGLGYTPALLAYVENGLSYSPIPYASYGHTPPNSYLNVISTLDIAVDNDNIYIYFMAGSTLFNGVTYDIRYYLLRETAN